MSTEGRQDLAPTILIVDDGQAVLARLPELFRAHGYSVRAVPADSPALADPASLHADLILIGSHFDLGRAVKCCRDLRAESSVADQPVIFVGPVDDHEARLEAFKAGGVDYLTDFVSDEEALARTRTHIALSRTRADLEQSERAYRDLFDKAPVGYQSLDADGRFLMVNDAWCGVLGYTPDEVIGKWFGDFLAPEYKDAFRERFPVFKAAGKIHSEFQMVHKDGNLHHIAFEGRIGCYPDGSFRQTHCVLQDVTAERRAAADLTASEDRLHNALMGSPYPIMLHAEDGEVVLIDHAWEQITGYSIEDIPTVHAWTEKAYGEGAEDVRSRVRALYATEDTTHMGEFTIRTASGEHRVWDFTSTPIGSMPDGRRLIMSTAHDVTEERASQSALQEEQERVKAVLDHAPYGAHMYELDSEDRLIFVDYNRTASELLGIDHEALLGKTLEEAFPGNVGTETPERYRRAARDGEAWETQQFAYDAAEISGVFDVIAFPFGPNEVCVFFRDVTGRWKLENALRESENRYSRLFETMQEGFAYYEVVTDERGVPQDWRVLDMNDAYECSIGLTDTVGKLVSEIAPDMRDRVSELFEAGSRVALSGIPEQLECRGILGRWKRFSISSPEKGRFIVMSEDIDDRKRAEVAAARSARALKALSGVNEALVRVRNEQDLLDAVVDTVVARAGYVLAWVGYAAQDDGKQIVPVATGGQDADYVAGLQLEWGEGPWGAGPAGRAVREGTTQVMRDLDENPQIVSREEAKARGLRAVAALPLRDRGGIAIGVLLIYSRDPMSFDDDEIQLLSEMAEDLSFGIDALKVRERREEIENDLREANAHLGVLLKEIVTTVGKVVETRDPYTQGHQLGVARIARQIAETMGLSADEVEAVEMAGLVHDIGKLSVPSEILTKPGALSAVEMALMRGHAEAGHDILRNIDFGPPIADIVLQHHERMDGSGYPAGLTGAKILRPARILAVADVIDAMASHRPYRPAHGVDDIVGELRDQERSFDPDVLEAAYAVLATGEGVPS